MDFIVYKGEYPFDIEIGTVQADNAEEALVIAIKQFGKEYPHPVIGPTESRAQ